MFPDIKFELRWNYKKWRIEKWFQKELKDILKNKWFITYHPSDIIWPSKFLDLFLITPIWGLHWLELKYITWSTFNVKKFEDWQIILLREMERRNPESCRVWIWSVKHKDYKILRFSEIWDSKNKKWWVKIFP